MIGHRLRRATQPSAPRRWGRAVALLVATMGLLLPPAASPARVAARSASYGSQAGLNYVGDMLTESDTALARDLDTVAGTGVTYLRLAVDWSLIQAGGPTSWNWTGTDRVVSAAGARGLHVLAVLVRAPAWASGTTASLSAPPRKASDWQTFAGAVGQRYIPRGVTAYELWNEPNIPTGWYPAVNATDYVNLVLVPGASALRSAASAAGTTITVISAGLAPALTWRTDVSPIDFLGRIYSNGGGNSFDAAGLHPYSAPYAPMSVTTGSRSVFYHAPDFYQVMVNNGDAGKKVWATEIGYATGSCGFNCVTLQQQSDMVPLAYSQWRSWTFTGPMLWFQSRDSGTDPSNQMRNFGLVTYDFTAKPALSTFTNLMATSPG